MAKPALHAAGRWEARVGVPSTRTRPSGRHVYLGLFGSEADAAKARGPPRWAALPG